VYVQTDLREVTSATRDAVGLIIIILLGLWELRAMVSNRVYG